MLVQNGADWVVTVPLSSVADPALVAQRLGAAGADFVDLDHESATLMSTFQREAVTLAIVGSLAILALLVVGLRSLGRAARVTLPLATAVAVTAALLTLGGGKLSIFMVTGFLLIIAIGSNYCLFFERAEPGTPAWERAIASIVLANLCTVAAYGLMALSRIPVLHDIGITVATGTFLSLVCGAVLSLPDKGRAP
jgi:predicted exporter